MTLPTGLDRFALALVAAGLVAGCGTVVGRETAPKTSVKRPAPTAAQTVQILIKFKARLAATELTSFRATYGLRNVGMIESLGVHVEEITSTRAIGDVLKELKSSPLVEYAELNGQVGFDDPVK